MPLWLSRTVPALFDGQEADAAKAWRLQLFEVLATLDGELPFRTVHDWHVRTVLPLAMETSARRGGTPALHEAVAALHRQSLAGSRPGAAQWAQALQPALREVLRHAYPAADAHARAHRSALAYAAANAAAIDAAYGSGEAYARHYADLSITANAEAYAAANADANAELLAEAFVLQSAKHYAETFPAAMINAHACGSAGEAAGTASRRGAYRRLAEGLIASLSACAGPNND
ncbi:hypothetical protein [Ramlibacter sp.]|uniref:hypothetical protein n=1 Tax=Ramlibacter sp. TaxID=1917967 RepID=UPI0017C56A08|nr:hypothetical protein [Ramlibacter sp.]MBA2672564.1 SpcZ [Ramlibacter sp.]